MFGDKTPTRLMGGAPLCSPYLFSGLILSSCPCSSQKGYNGGRLRDTHTHTTNPFLQSPRIILRETLNWPCLERRFIPEPITEARKIESPDWSALASGVATGSGTFGGPPLGLHARTRSLLPVNSNRQSPQEDNSSQQRGLLAGTEGQNRWGQAALSRVWKKPICAFMLPIGTATRGQHPLVVTTVSASQRLFPAGGAAYLLVLRNRGGRAGWGGKARGEGRISLTSDTLE